MVVIGRHHRPAHSSIRSTKGGRYALGVVLILAFLAILVAAYRETEQNQKALEVLTANEEVPVHVEELSMQPREGNTRITGSILGNAATAGTPVQLRFTFYGANGELGTQTVTVNAPAADATTSFEVVFESTEPVVAYRYELVR